MIRLLVRILSFFIFLLQSARLALEQIWANKARSILTTIGIVIGVASVTAVIAAVTGLKTKVISEFETFGTNNIYVWPQRPDSGRHKNASWRIIRFKPEHFEGLVEHCPSVEHYTYSTWQRETVRRDEHFLEGIRIQGISPAWHKIENRSVTAGRPFAAIDQLQARQVCLITEEVRDKLHLDRDCTGQRILIGGRAFCVVGVVEEKVGSWFQQGDSKGEVFIPFETSWKIWKPWFSITAASKKPELSEDAQAELRFFLRGTRQLKPGDPDTFSMEVVEKHLSKIREMSHILTMVAVGIVGISLLVGGVGIMNIMLVSVSERTREIGLRKAVGARPSTILLQFLVESVVLCLTGGLIGVLLGELLTSLITRIPNAELVSKSYVPGWAIALAFGFSAVVGLFFGMFPAVKAARLDPINALRHE